MNSGERRRGAEIPWNNVQALGYKIGKKRKLEGFFLLCMKAKHNSKDYESLQLLCFQFPYIPIRAIVP